MPSHISFLKARHVIVSKMPFSREIFLPKFRKYVAVGGRGKNPCQSITIISEENFNSTSFQPHQIFFCNEQTYSKETRNYERLLILWHFIQSSSININMSHVWPWFSRYLGRLAIRIEIVHRSNRSMYSRLNTKVKWRMCRKSTCSFGLGEFQMKIPGVARLCRRNFLKLHNDLTECWISPNAGSVRCRQSFLINK